MTIPGRKIAHGVSTPAKNRTGTVSAAIIDPVLPMRTIRSRPTRTVIRELMTVPTRKLPLIIMKNSPNAAGERSKTPAIRNGTPPATTMNTPMPQPA